MRRVVCILGSYLRAVACLCHCHFVAVREAKTRVSGFSPLVSGLYPIFAIDFLQIAEFAFFSSGSLPEAPVLWHIENGQMFLKLSANLDIKSS